MKADLSPYHSAVKADLPDVKAIKAYEWEDGSSCFQMDVSIGILDRRFDQCDCFYAEPPWRPGVKVFDQRAGVSKPSNFASIIQGINQIIAKANRPCVIFSSNQDRKLYAQPDAAVPIVNAFHDYKSFLLIYNLSIPLEGSTNEDAIHFLAKHFDCVGDFCAGYGRTGRIFREHGKRFVLSDYNGKCVAVMASTL